MLVLDTSASMTAADVAPSRLEAAEARARTFVDGLPGDVQIGIVTFNGGASLAVAPTKDRTALLAGLDNLQVGGGTATADGIRAALAAIEGVPRDEGDTTTPAAIVLMSDGTPTIGSGLGDPITDAEQAAADARAVGVPVHTIAFGTAAGTVQVEGRTVAVPVDSDAMARIAEASGGRTFTAESADELGRCTTRSVATWPTGSRPRTCRRRWPAPVSRWPWWLRRPPWSGPSASSDGHEGPPPARRPRVSVDGGPVVLRFTCTGARTARHAGRTSSGEA